MLYLWQESQGWGSAVEYVKSNVKSNVNRHVKCFTFKLEGR